MELKITSPLQITITAKSVTIHSGNEASEIKKIKLPIPHGIEVGMFIQETFPPTYILSIRGNECEANTLADLVNSKINLLT